jgi:hypothetical protein
VATVYIIKTEEVTKILFTVITLLQIIIVSRNTTNLLYYVYNMFYNYMFRPFFFRPSSGCIHYALRLMYPIYKYTTLMMRSQSSLLYNCRLIVTGMWVD